MKGRAAPPHPKIYRVPPPPRPGWKPPSNIWPKGVATGNIKFHFPAFLPGGGRGEIESSFSIDPISELAISFSAGAHLSLRMFTI